MKEREEMGKKILVITIRASYQLGGHIESYEINLMVTQLQENFSLSICGYLQCLWKELCLKEGWYYNNGLIVQSMVAKVLVNFQKGSHI